MLANVTMPHESAFPFTAGISISRDVHNHIIKSSAVFGESGLHYERLYLHILAMLDIADEKDFSDSQLERLVEAPLDRDSHAGRLRHLL